jgi:hypothetical protein
MTTMTSKEREQLARLLRLRAKVAKDAIGQQEAMLRADVEAQLSAQYKFDDAKWQDVTRVAQEAVAKADAEIAKRCESLGIASQFRPSIGIGWSNRGENLLASRRAELRMAARTRIEELGKEAKVAIDRVMAEKMTTLIAGGLESAEAKKFIEAIPSIDELMPRFQIEKLAITPSRRSRYLCGDWKPGDEQKEIAD